LRSSYPGSDRLVRPRRRYQSFGERPLMRAERKLTSEINRFRFCPEGDIRDSREE
jgi:hypothetical protein